MALSKTRKLFVESARQLFAKLGFDGTTMNDIAQQAKKGRRTLYTYFRSKDDIFAAVVQNELEILYQELEHFSRQRMLPQNKLVRFASRRFEAIDHIVKRNGSLSADFFKDIQMVERTRLRFDVKERKLIEKILQDGVDQGVFQIDNITYMALLIQNSFKGLEVPYIRGLLGRTNEEKKAQLLQLKSLIMYGLSGRK